VPILIHQKITKSYCVNNEKPRKKLSYKKAAHKMLMKLTKPILPRFFDLSSSPSVDSVEAVVGEAAEASPGHLPSIIIFLSSQDISRFLCITEKTYRKEFWIKNYIKKLELH